MVKFEFSCGSFCSVSGSSCGLEEWLWSCRSRSLLNDGSPIEHGVDVGRGKIQLVRGQRCSLVVVVSCQVFCAKIPPEMHERSTHVFLHLITTFLKKQHSSNLILLWMLNWLLVAALHAEGVHRSEADSFEGHQERTTRN